MSRRVFFGHSTEPTFWYRRPGHVLSVCEPTAPAAASSWSDSGCDPAHVGNFAEEGLQSH